MDVDKVSSFGGDDNFIVYVNDNEWTGNENNGDFSLGDYQWRVRAIDVAGSEGEWFEPFAVTINPPPTASPRILVLDSGDDTGASSSDRVDGVLGTNIINHIDTTGSGAALDPQNFTLNAIYVDISRIKTNIIQSDLEGLTAFDSSGYKLENVEIIAPDIFAHDDGSQGVLADVAWSLLIDSSESIYDSHF